MHAETRPASRSDVAFARSAHHAAYREIVERQFGPWDEVQQDLFFDQDWQLEEAEIILSDGKACGYWIVQDRPNDIHLREFVLHPDCQSRGLGRFLLAQLQHRAEARQVPIRLGTFLHSRAVGLYERTGFREIDRTDTHILLEWSPPKKAAAS